MHPSIAAASFVALLSAVASGDSASSQPGTGISDASSRFGTHLAPSFLSGQHESTQAGAQTEQASTQPVGDAKSFTCSPSLPSQKSVSSNVLTQGSVQKRATKAPVASRSVEFTDSGYSIWSAAMTIGNLAAGGLLFYGCDWLVGARKNNVKLKKENVMPKR
jgi:hypothetical protein